jgi:hypothetical protein
MQDVIRICDAENVSMSIETEKHTVETMVRMYCRGHHRKAGPCDECGELLEYALGRLDHCRFGDSKPACKNCPVHCYAPGMRVRMRDVMKYSGPRLMLVHPRMALRHLRSGKVTHQSSEDEPDRIRRSRSGQRMCHHARLEECRVNDARRHQAGHGERSDALEIEQPAGGEIHQVHIRYRSDRAYVPSNLIAWGFRSDGHRAIMVLRYRYPMLHAASAHRDDHRCHGHADGSPGITYYALRKINPPQGRERCFKAPSSRSPILPICASLSP